MSFLETNKRYEAWLRKQCKVDKNDLRTKHKRMTKDAFTFLRSTFFRWAGEIEALLPELAGAPAVLSIGDTHVQNFGCWRDWEGRLIWGANDFDEAAIIPYPFDLVRLATSARLAPNLKVSNRYVADTLLEGYVAGLRKPAPFVLGEHSGWLLNSMECDDRGHEKFWRGIDALPNVDPPASVQKALKASLPAGGGVCRFASRSAGDGSLGRPRYVVIGSWRGGHVVREAKALVTSAWEWAHGRPDAGPQYLKLAKGRDRAPDPFLKVVGRKTGRRYVVRRLAADSQKAELGANPGSRLDLRLLSAMGRELGGLHAGRSGMAASILKDLDGRDEGWLYAAAKKAAEFVEGDFDEWKQKGPSD